ncbi:uncharacterized protein LOC125682093 isoform X2 [Ostrea edulis]|uniref:uncharacterized protein LOC125682093 isoform X2 n=1 Tax=Ostrea edulis TaxID=37623 RepID=UPI0024AF624F|nr:uncharacterized protein LOC125682093 isoform X2 [Ostrea edulis]
MGRFLATNVSLILRGFPRHYCVGQASKTNLSQLRKRTGVPLKNCRAALQKCHNNLEEAEKWLKEQAQKEGWARADKLQSRPMSQGLLGLIQSRTGATMIESNEVKNSNGMEKRGLERAVDWVKNNDLEIGTIVTDRHLQIQKWIRENLPETTHYYDVWHVAKGLKKKVLATAKQSECGQLSKWSRSLTNHLYWVATSTPNGDGDLMWAKWESVENHVHNKHEGHNELFPSCAHGMLYGDERKKKWIKPGSKASEKISDIILSNRMKRDIPKLSPLYQTSQIEAFHSTVNHFAPKMVAFSYYGMYCRLIVAALHFNENTSRVQAATKEGNMQFKISFPKFKHGEYSVRKRTVDSTYGYVTSLMTETFTSMEASVDATSPHQPPVSCLPEIQPPPLCSNFVHPEKSEAVQHFRSRFMRKETPV